MQHGNDSFRLMRRAEAAAYCACNPATCSRWVAAGLLPKSIPGIQRWDRRAIDERLNFLSGLTGNSSIDDPYVAWKNQDVNALPF